MQNITTTTDDLENREISAAAVHGVHPKWAVELSGVCPRVDGQRERLRPTSTAVGLWFERGSQSWGEYIFIGARRPETLAIFELKLSHNF